MTERFGPDDQVIDLPDLAATQRWGYQLGQTLTAGTVLLLQGSLGAGKTALVGSIAQGLGITEPVVSPTFVLLNEYPEGRLPLYHFDLYRLAPEEATSLHAELYWEGQEVEPGIVAIEWPERLPELPPAYWHLSLIGSGDGPRQLTIQHKPSPPPR